MTATIGSRDARAKMDRPLDSDQLGRKGEKAFEGFCIDAGLIANPSSWDRKGWDFVVDWRDAGSDLSYDKRPTPRSCLAQIKTVWMETRSLRFRLSSIDHLAKDLKPAFVVVLKVDNDLSVREAAIAHLEGDLLALVLKTLREASASDTAINTLEIDLSLAKWFTSIEPSAAAIRDALESRIGASMDVYSSRKQDQLRNLGYGERRSKLTATAIVHDKDSLIDGFLGLRPLEFVDAIATETRFGISLPDDQFGGKIANFKVLPTVQDTCRILVRSEGSEPVLSFKGKIYSAPHQVQSEGRLKLLIRSELFDLILDARQLEVGGGVMNYTFSWGAGLRKARVGPNEWADFYSLLARLQRGGEVSIEVHPKKRKMPLRSNLSLNVPDANQQDWEEGAVLARAASELFQRAGWPATKLAIRDLVDAQDGILLAADLLRDPQRISPLSIGLVREPGRTRPDAFDLLFFHHLRIGEHLVVMAVMVSMNAAGADQRDEYRHTNLAVREIVRLKPTERIYESYTSAYLKRHNIESFYIKPFGGDAGPKGRRSRALKADTAA